MKLPIIDKNEVVPVRFIPFITHGKYGRETITSILSLELKICGWESESEAIARHQATVARMAAERAGRMGMKLDDGISPMDDILSGDCEEESFSSLNWEEPYAYRLNNEGKPELVPIDEWRTVSLKIKPLIEFAHLEEDKIGIEGVKRQEWHSATLKVIPDDAFMWKADLEKIYPPDRLNYNVWIDPECRFIVQEAFDRLSAVTKKPEPVNKESTRAIETLQKMLVVMAKDGYRYDPQAKNNGEAMKSIQDSFADAGLSVSENTIRTHLKAGAQLIDRLKHQ